MTQLIQQQYLLHQLHVGRDEAVLTVGVVGVEHHLSDTAGDVQ